MPIEILMPALSPTMTEGNLAKWLKKEGDKINPGDVIAEIETDKATMEVEAVDEGVLAKVIVAEGQENVPVNSLIAVLLEEGEKLEDIDKFVKSNGNNSRDKLPESLPQKPVEIPMQASVQDPIHNNGGRIFASPLAKRLAVINNINLKDIKGSGPH